MGFCINSSMISLDGKSSLTMAFFRICNSDFKARRFSLKKKMNVRRKKSLRHKNLFILSNESINLLPNARIATQTHFTLTTSTFCMALYASIMATIHTQCLVIDFYLQFGEFIVIFAPLMNSVCDFFKQTI